MVANSTRECICSNQADRRRTCMLLVWSRKALLDADSSMHRHGVPDEPQSLPLVHPAGRLKCYCQPDCGELELGCLKPAAFSSTAMGRVWGLLGRLTMASKLTARTCTVREWMVTGCARENPNGHDCFDRKLEAADRQQLVVCSELCCLCTGEHHTYS